MKYMGSKSRIKKHILPILQGVIDKNNITMFIDVFCGGCNVIDDIKCKVRIANDLSTPLIELWKGVQRGEKIPNEIPKELYDDVRANKDNDKYEKWFVGAVGFLASYNGRYFDGGYAKTLITKTGVLRNYYLESKNNIEAQIGKLKDVKFFNKDYRSMNNITNALIYCDPPYKDTKQYSTSKGFNHDEFWEWCRKFSKDNIVIVSELQAPDDFICIWEQAVTRTQNNRDRFKSIEKLFIHKDNINKI